MSQIEQEFRYFLAKHPEIEKCYQQGLINRRSLARHLIRNTVAKSNQLEAVIAMLRRFPFQKSAPQEKDAFKDARISVKERILIFSFSKDKDLFKSLQKVAAATDYDRGDTLKIVVGTSSITVFVDEKNEEHVREVAAHHESVRRPRKVSEMSLLFSGDPSRLRGTLSTVTRELVLNDIVIAELLTSSQELLIYVEEKYVIKAYAVLKELVR